jgi:hypothetical protein
MSGKDRGTQKKKVNVAEGQNGVNKASALFQCGDGEVVGP